MFQHDRLRSVFCLAIAILYFSCGEDASQTLDDKNESADGQDLSGKEGSDTDTLDQITVQDSSTNGFSSQDIVTADIQVPGDFDCTPVSISTFFYNSTNTSAIPGGIGDNITTPEMVPGETCEIKTTQAGLDGSYYFAVVVYCENGGNGLLPVAGVDWIGISESAIDIGAGTGVVDAGDITIIVYNGLDRDTSYESDSEQNPNDKVSASIQIPADFNCNPISLSTLYYASANMSGIPSAFGNNISTSEMKAGESFEFETTQDGLEGPFHLAVVIYCEGGGNGLLPVSGVDWLGITPSPVTLGLGTGVVDAGDVPIRLAE